MNETLRERDLIYRGLFIPESQLLQYMKAARETGIGLRIVKRPGEYVDELNQYEKLSEEFFIGLSFTNNAEYTTFRLKVDSFLAENTSAQT